MFLLSILTKFIIFSRGFLPVKPLEKLVYLPYIVVVVVIVIGLVFFGHLIRVGIGVGVGCFSGS